MKLLLRSNQYHCASIPGDYEQQVSVLSSNKRICLGFPGCTLFFYETDGRSGIDNNSIPKHAIWVENSIVQAVPEHPKKDYVFCLSNSLGDAFLFQVRDCLNVILSINKCRKMTMTYM